MKKSSFLIAYLLFSVGVFAQQKQQIDWGIQSNVLSFVRYHPAVNISFVEHHGRSFFREFGLDVGIALPELTTSENVSLRLNQYETSMAGLPTLDFSFAQMHFFNENTGWYRGFKASFGWFAFRHDQLWCSETRYNGEVCICETLEEVSTVSQTIRLGGAFRTGYLLKAAKRHYFDFGLEIGMFYHHRLRNFEPRPHATCEGIPSARQDQILLPESIFTFGLLDFNSNVYPYMRFLISYRYLL
jgi:hypothetical protein